MNPDAQRSALLARIQAIIREAVGAPDVIIHEGSTTRDVAGWDSLTHVSIILMIEKAFSIKLTSAEVARLETVGSLVDIVLARSKSNRFDEVKDTSLSTPL
jgi:acyl carrier protein